MHNIKGSLNFTEFRWVWLRYGKNNHTNKLTTNRKPMLGVCEENKNEIWLKYFAVKGSILQVCRKTVM